MKNPQEAAFGSKFADGMTKQDYVKIEVLKSLILPGKNYTNPEIEILLSTTDHITRRLFEI